MRRIPQSQTDPAEVALLAFVAWQREGRPAGSEDRIWREVEAQLAATRSLLAKELQSPTSARARRTTTRAMHPSAAPGQPPLPPLSAMGSPQYRHDRPQQVAWDPII